jgi:hypothetical protein
VAQIDLLFSQLPVTGQPVEIVFGADDGTPTVATDAYLSGTLPQPGLQGTITIGPVVDAAIAVTLPQPGLDALLDMRQVYAVQLAGTLPQPGPLADLPAEYLSNTSRPTVGQAFAPWTPGARMQTGTQDNNQDTAATPVGTAPRWQHAAPTPAQAAAPIANALRAPVAHSTGFAQGIALATRAAALHQDAVRSVRNLLAEAFANALRAQTQPLTQRHQDGLRDRRPLRQTHWQVAQPTPPKSYTSGQGPAQWLNKGFGGDHQNAMRPPPGIYVPPPIPGADPCYLPTHLVFDDAWSSSTGLVFVCERHGPGPGPGQTIVVPVRSTYIVINNITLHRVDTGAELHAHSFSMSLDHQSWTWTWVASLHNDAAAHLGRDSAGDPAELAVLVNGIEFRLRLETISRDRRFSPTRWSVSGRGKASVLGAADAPKQSFRNTADRTAQQLMADVLTVNGVPMGWTVDWGLQDWLVPAGAWAIQGNYIDAINDIAGAVGGYVQPHATAATLRVLPRYPLAPWNWGSVTPDFEIPADAAEVERTQYIDKPAYNRVFVGGIGAGVFGPFTRAGTAGNVIAPQVNHALITHADAHRQRGIAELSDTGRQERITLNMQVLPETGVIVPGRFVRYLGDAPVMGIVRATSIDWSRPRLRQTLEVETHA